MTPKEFKAWFDGFTEAFAGCPTKAQWTRIKERVAEIDGKETTERVFVDRYLPYYPVYIYPFQYYPLGGGGWSCTGLAQGTLNNQNLFNHTQGLNNWSSTSAMYSLGQVDAQALTVVS